MQLCLNDKRKFYSVLSEEQFQHTDNFVDCESLRNVMILLHNFACAHQSFISHLSLSSSFFLQADLSVLNLSVLGVFEC